jgi:transposase
MIVWVRNRQELEHQIVVLHAQGWSIRALCRHFAMGRNTIRRILRKNRKQRDKGHDVLDRQRPAVRQSKLNAFKPMIKQLIEQYPDITGVRVYEELVVSGYQGGRTIVTDYLRKIRPRPKKAPVVRYETPPGYQGQMLFAPAVYRFYHRSQVLHPDPAPPGCVCAL